MSACRQLLGWVDHIGVVTSMTTTTATPISSELRTAGLTGLGLGLLWLVLGLATDGTTYHLGPLLVAAVPALIYALESSAVTLGKVLSLVGGGVALALAISASLSATGRLTGPSLLPVGGAALEAVVFALLGGLAGAVVGAWKQHS